MSRQIRKANVSEPLLGEDEILYQLKTFLTSLHSKIADRQSVGQSSVATLSDQVMKDVCGFVLERRDSKLPGLSGRGVFVKDGIVPARNIVALYPGCVCACVRVCVHVCMCSVCMRSVCMHSVCVCACVRTCMRWPCISTVGVTLYMQITFVQV